MRPCLISKYVIVRSILLIGKVEYLSFFKLCFVCLVHFISSGHVLQLSRSII